MSKKNKKKKIETLLLRNLEQKDEQGGAQTARVDFETSAIAAIYIAIALLDNALERGDTLSDSALAYVREVLKMMGAPCASSDPADLSYALIQLKPTINDEEALKKQMANLKALKLLQIT